ncbi:MAG: hypothetical protein LBQ49_02450, partial [Rickettsiales bacterium]|nr:hypothetical protein [Rickettsiales bacterium]
KANAFAEKIYADLSAAGIEAVLDARDARAGEKFADADLIAAPIRLIVSEKNSAAGAIEVKYRLRRDTTKLPASISAENYMKELLEILNKLK